MASERCGRMLFLVLLLIALCEAQKGQYYVGYQVIRVNVNSREQLELFADLETEYNEEDFDIWAYPNVERQIPADVSISPRVQTRIKSLLTASGMQYAVSVTDLQMAIDKERQNNEEQSRVERRRKRRSTTPVLEEMLNTFPRYAKHKEWLQHLESTYPSHVETFSLGSTYEKRDINAIKIFADRNATKRMILIDGGIHGREHLSVATCNFLIYSLLNGVLTNDPEVMAVMNKYDVVLIPILNPDGYEYTHSGRRMWRKNKKVFNRRCIGVDVNRNFVMGYDSASYEEMRCHSAIYRGDRAFSEKESAAFQQFVLRHRFQIDFYINLHAYSQYILFPWAYTADPVDDYSDLMRVGQAAADAIYRNFNETFIVGVPPMLLYPAPGAAMDWTKSIGVKYSYAIEVRPGSDFGNEGFLATLEMIRPSGQDILVALKAMVTEAQAISV